MFAYADETGTPERDLSGVAAYVFSDDGAKQFRHFYESNIHNRIPLNKNGVRLYHTSRCATGSREYEGMDDSERQQIIDLMVQCISQSATLGVAVLLPRAEYEKARDASPPVVECSGSPYSVCLVRCMNIICDWLDQKELGGGIDYVFEAGDRHQREANDFLRRISLSPELNKRYRMHEFSFMPKGPEVPQLFAPDLLAWEWQRAHVNASKPQRGEWRMTLKNLFDGTPHVPLYLTATSIGIQSMINKFYNLDGSMDQW